MLEETKKVASKKPEGQVKKRCAEKVRIYFSERKLQTYANRDKQVKRLDRKSVV